MQNEAVMIADRSGGDENPGGFQRYGEQGAKEPNEKAGQYLPLDKPGDQQKA